MWAERVNNAGGINAGAQTHTVTLDFRDDGSDGDQAVSIVTSMLDNDEARARLHVCHSEGQIMPQGGGVPCRRGSNSFPCDFAALSELSGRVQRSGIVLSRAGFPQLGPLF